MSKEIRGSEKLKRECTGRLLSREELEQVAGGFGLNLPQTTYRIFPNGIPWPDLFKPVVPEIDQVALDIKGLAR